MTTAQQQTPSRLVFRTPATAVLGGLLLIVTMTPFASASPWLLPAYLVPLGLIAAVLRLRTTADADGLVVRTLFRRRRLPWSDIRALRLSERSWVRAVLTSGTEQPLPSVRTHHLPALALISGGRLDDPTAPPASAPETESGTASQAPAAATADD
ncbi:PH domain-containing protein [Actinophytocola xanthii]|uniref:PH domain-containing protein n=1 Tax=Actinophytocola xanthii TaxID=1912961 RepID=UPI0009F84421|nr:PH domain-containing protein [Actinophytocola xanthii]